MVRSNARVASLWHRNLCIPSNRCLSTAKFIASSAISQSCRRVPSAAPCAPSSLFAAGLFRHSAPPLDPFNRNFPPLSSAPDLLRNSFGNFPIFISARYYIKNSKLAPLSSREFSLSVIKDSQPLTISARRRSFPAISPFLDIHLLQSIL